MNIINEVEFHAGVVGEVLNDWWEDFTDSTADVFLDAMLGAAAAESYTKAGFSIVGAESSISSLSYEYSVGAEAIPSKFADKMGGVFDTESIASAEAQLKTYKGLLTVSRAITIGAGVAAIYNDVENKKETVEAATLKQAGILASIEMVFGGLLTNVIDKSISKAVYAKGGGAALDALGAVIAIAMDRAWDNARETYVQNLGSLESKRDLFASEAWSLNTGMSGSVLATYESMIDVLRNTGMSDIASIQQQMSDIEQYMQDYSTASEWDKADLLPHFVAFSEQVVSGEEGLLDSIIGGSQQEMSSIWGELSGLFDESIAKANNDGDLKTLTSVTEIKTILEETLGDIGSIPLDDLKSDANNNFPDYMDKIKKPFCEIPNIVPKYDSLLPSFQSNFSTAEVTQSPLVLDLDGDGVETLGTDSAVFFDHDNNGFAENSGWISSDDGILVRDLNGNGIIDSGAELFGDNTILEGGEAADNGFEALADLDSNHDGVFDGLDDAFGEVKVWKDADSDGVTDTGELLSLNEAGVTSINLSYTNTNTTDENNNQHLQAGSYTITDDTTAVIEDVWFDADKARTLDNTEIEISEEIAALPNVLGFGNVHNLQTAMALDEIGRLKSLVEQYAATNNYSAVFKNAA